MSISKVEQRWSNWRGGYRWKRWWSRGWGGRTRKSTKEKSPKGTWQVKGYAYWECRWLGSRVQRRWRLTRKWRWEQWRRAWCGREGHGAVLRRLFLVWAWREGRSIKHREEIEVVIWGSGRSTGKRGPRWFCLIRPRLVSWACAESIGWWRNHWFKHNGYCHRDYSE